MDNHNLERANLLLFFGNYILEFPDEIIPHWSIARMRLAVSLRYTARRTGTGVGI
ncbi:MAG: hypothetical protein IKP00_17230 [Victivallales bacterium]|nr:hypothetical protein [Victivallales bacterium]